MEILPLVPLRDMVVFPHMMAPFVVGRESSIRALEAALATPVKRIFLAAQNDPKLDEPKPEDIYEVGVVATVVQTLKLPERQHQGDGRGRAPRPDHGLRAQAASTCRSGWTCSRSSPSDAESLREYMDKVLALFEQYAKLSHHLAFEGLPRR